MRKLSNIFVFIFLASLCARANQPFDVFERAKERISIAKNSTQELSRKNEYLRAILDLKDFTEKFPLHPKKPEAYFLMATAYHQLGKDMKDREDAIRAVHYFKLAEAETSEIELKKTSLSAMAEICENLLNDTGCKKDALTKLNQIQPQATDDSFLPIDLTDLAKEHARTMAMTTLPLVKSVKLEPKDSEFFIKVELDQPASAYTYRFLGSSQKDKTPPRFYVDIDKAKLPSSVVLPSLPEQVPISGMRLAQNTMDKVRLVVDLNAAVKESDCKVTQKENEMLISIKGNASPTMSISTSTPPISWSSLDTGVVDFPRSALAKKKTYRVIIDPGHGGDDAGAIGPFGNYEKDVCLNVSLKLRDLLKKNPKYEILMTRETDKTIALGDRTKFANKMKGDLFVSIHANASPKRSARGVSTYFLHNADDQESLRVAMRENGELVMPQGDQSVSEDHYLEVMKASMVKNFHTILSTDLARQVQAAMLQELKRGYKDVYDMGVRSARFYVLTGAEMPSVLVETSFISNPQEEKRLVSSSYQSKLAMAIMKAIEQFFKLQEKTPAHAVYIKK